MSIITCFGGNDVLVHSLREGEEPGLTHYYFYYKAANTEGGIVRVRWVIDSDLRNNSKVTDFIIGSGAITVKKFIGNEAARKLLIQGKDTKESKASEHIITTTFSEAKSKPSSEREPLSIAKQRGYLGILIDLLSRYKPLQK